MDVAQLVLDCVVQLVVILVLENAQLLVRIVVEPVLKVVLEQLGAEDAAANVLEIVVLQVIINVEAAQMIVLVVMLTAAALVEPGA